MSTSEPKLQEQAVPSEVEAQQDRLAAQLRGFGPLGIAAILAIVFSGNWFLGNFGGMGLAIPVGGILVLLWARWSRTPLREIGYIRPENLMLTIAAGILLGTVFKFVMKAIVMPLLGADPINHTFHFLVGNRAALPAAIWAMIMAGFGEETVFRGYLFERFGKLMGCSLVSKILIVLITSTGLGLAHYLSQGLAGTQQATIVGLLFGAIFATTRRILLLISAHAAFDLTALAMIYWDFEYRVAHLVFK